MKNIVRTILILVLICSFALESGAAKRKKTPVNSAALECVGVMEGFADVREGLEARLDHYISLGYTHYFYSPSDDRYCNRWGWKFAYNDVERKDMSEISRLCRNKGLVFVWTLTPGERYSGSETDYAHLLNKLVVMYYSGIRSFAVNFDSHHDFEGVGKRLREDLAAKLPEPVSIYMTDEVPQVKYPSETDPARQLMKGYRFDAGFTAQAERLEAVVCNIRSADEFSLFALMATAAFASDPSSYSADRTLAESVAQLDDEPKGAFLAFLHHTKGGEQESADVSVFALDDWTREKSDNLKGVFAELNTVPERLVGMCNPTVERAMKPWFDVMGRLGRKGMNALKCMDAYKSGDMSAFWLNYVSGMLSPEDSAAFARYPVGSERLLPFCRKTFEDLETAFTEDLTGQTVLRNLAGDLHKAPDNAFDSDLTTYVNSCGHKEFPIPASANTCHLLLGSDMGDKPVYFRQLGTDGRLIAEFRVRSPFMTFDLKAGAVKVDVMGNVDIYETIFVDL